MSDIETWWETIQSSFPSEVNAKAYEKHALWEYLNGKTACETAAEKVMIIHEEDYRLFVISDECGKSYFRKNSDIADIALAVCVTHPDLVPAILDLIEAIEVMQNFEIPEAKKLQYPEWHTWTLRKTWVTTVLEWLDSLSSLAT